MIRLRRVRILAGTVVLALAATGVAVAGSTGSSATGSTAESTKVHHEGVINGAKFRVEVPDNWNGTVVLYSHGYYPAFFPEVGVLLSNDTDTEPWLLEHGYALAGSLYQNGGRGYVVKEALTDQLAVLDWFEANIGKPRRTISYGQSLGATIATLLAERNPRRFDGVANICGGFDPVGIYNSALDIQYAVKKLLVPANQQDKIDLVKAGTNAEASTNALAAAVGAAAEDDKGRAKLALIASFGAVAGWWNAFEPKPTTDEEWIRRQALWIQGAYIFGHGPNGRADTEAHAGGNPSWNIGVDYRRQLARSGDVERVRRAYRAADIDLSADLKALNAGKRIAPDPAAVGFMYRFGVPVGTTPAPVIMTHTTGDGGAPTASERWYAGQVRKAGNPAKLRQLYLERGAHCSISAAEEIVMLTSLSRRIESGRWPDLSSRTLNAKVNGFAPKYREVYDLVTDMHKEMPPTYVNHHPLRWPRPAR